MQILDKGRLEILDSMGTDETIARAAWVSYGKQDKEQEDGAVEKLINYLIKHRHGTPFEHVVFTFYVKAPLFVAREWFRHRIGSFNEISGRYVTFKPEFYMPKQFRVKAATNKQGSVIPTDESLFDHDWFNGFDTWNEESRYLLDDAYESAYDSYTYLKDHKVANEIARLVMPLGLYTEFWWTVNLRSLMNFMSLRSDSNAQWEIQEYSRALEQIAQEKVPLAYAAFINNGRIAP